MKKRTTSLHRGQLLEEAVKATRLKKEDVAAKAGYQRTSYYKHIKERDLPYHILTAYGKAIRYDFTELLPEMPKYMIEEPDEQYSPMNLEEARKQIDYWRDKYIDLLELFNKMILDMKGKQ